MFGTRSIMVRPVLKPMIAPQPLRDAEEKWVQAVVMRIGDDFSHFPIDTQRRLWRKLISHFAHLTEDTKK